MDLIPREAKSNPESIHTPAQEPPVQGAPDSGKNHNLVLPAGSSRVHLCVEVPEGACLEVEVEALTANGRSLGSQSLVFQDGQAPTVLHRAGAEAAPAWGRARGRWKAWARLSAAELAVWLFWAALGIYAITRLVALPDFPIYFFTDEAIQTIQAADLLRDRLHSLSGEFLPTFFENGSQFNLGTSVYLQVLPYLLFGKSVWVTRGIAALMTLTAAVSVGLILKRIFKSPYPWLAVLILAITPAWFLHSRTAFETGLATSLYAAFLYFYLVYRHENPRYLYLAVLFGALVFYSYSPMRMVILVTGALLFFSDLGYHRNHRKTLLLGFNLALLLALPYVRFLINHPDANEWQMRLLGSYWIMDIPITEKLKAYGAEYLRGLDIFYWYLPHSKDLPRHTMLNYGHLLRQTLPLGFAGVGLALYRLRHSAYRTILIALLAAPSGAALVQLGITRALVMVVPMAILTALAVSEGLEWLHRRKGVPRTAMALAVFALFSAGSLYMLFDALRSGPLWYDNYTLTGQQWGGEQIFQEIRETLRRSPDTELLLSPSWANGTDVIARFFFDDPMPFKLGSVRGYFNEIRPLTDKTLFVMIPEEFADIPRDKFAEVNVEKIVPYPDGRPGFYFVRLKYVENIAEVMTAENEIRHQPDTHTFLLGDSLVTLDYTKLDIGEPKHIFDGNQDTLIRSWGINPMILDFAFDTPQEFSTVGFHIGGNATTIKVEVWADGEDAGQVFTQQFDEVPRPRGVEIAFGSTIKVRRLRAEILNTNDLPEGHVHLWEVIFEK